MIVKLCGVLRSYRCFFIVLDDAFNMSERFEVSPYSPISFSSFRQCDELFLRMTIELEFKLEYPR